MINYQKIKKYKISGSIFHDDNITVLIAFLGEHPGSNVFIINKFIQSAENKQILSEIFGYFNSHTNEDFVDFFAEYDYFYAIFKYKKAQTITYKYKKKLNTTIFHTRYKLLIHILINLYNFSRNPALSKLVFKNISNPENITISKTGKVHFVYDLRDYNYEDISNTNLAFEKYILKNIGKIIKIILNEEAISKYNTILKIILKKCNLGIYKSIPEIVTDIKNNNRTIKISSLLTYLKAKFELYKPLLPKLSSIILIPALIIGVVYLIFGKIQQQNKNIEISNEVTIGEISYSAGAQVNKTQNIVVENTNVIPKAVSESKINININSQISIDYEDYIVKQNDTFLTIAESHYGSTDLTDAISAFNNMETSQALLPGTLIRIPNQQDLVAYLES
ncbi:MAG: LysM peptidoglycan-binding domain-containing protein [Candidatus Improbicoccus devescovinae]|nr:MAG: LysM peptidoglycan-binding domain-containing protein [Candidatus Improbicoccus devescovinae]